MAILCLSLLQPGDSHSARYGRLGVFGSEERRHSFDGLLHFTTATRQDSAYSQ
jgi:hypothetical protein